MGKEVGVIWEKRGALRGIRRWFINTPAGTLSVRCRNCVLNAPRTPSTGQVGPLLQYNCPGFLPNQRQQLMGGLVRAWPLSPTSPTTMQKFRIVTVGIGTRRQRIVLERWTNARVVRVALGTGCTRGERKRRGSRNGRVSDLPPKSLRTISQLFHQHN